MTGDVEIFVEADGAVQFVYSDALAALFDGDDLRTSRASHVEPFVGGGWFADVRPVGGPVLFANVSLAFAGDVNWLGSLWRPGDVAGFATRQAALDAEVAWLRAAMARQKLEAR